jgi:hypothetical protein
LTQIPARATISNRAQRQGRSAAAPDPEGIDNDEESDMKDMTAEELRLAIDQAWKIAQQTTGSELEEAKRHLSVLREAQAAMASRMFNVSVSVDTTARPQ